jgi:hypothetical protein
MKVLPTAKAINCVLRKQPYFETQAFIFLTRVIYTPYYEKKLSPFPWNRC